jgi:hypothetical protein
VRRIGDHDVHRGAECGAPEGRQRHDAPLTVLADEALPLLAEPLESDEELLLDVGEEVLVVAVVVIDAVVAAVVVPAWVNAATPASAATATVPAIPDVVVSLLRSRRARSRSATVILRLLDFTIGSGGGVFTHLRMRTSPGAGVRDSWANPGNPRQWPPGLPPPLWPPGPYPPVPPMPGHVMGSVLLVAFFGLVVEVSVTVVGWTAIRTGAGLTERVRPIAVTPVAPIATCWWDAGCATAGEWPEANPVVPSSIALTAAATTNEPAPAMSFGLMFIMGKHHTQMRQKRQMAEM